MEVRESSAEPEDAAEGPPSLIKEPGRLRKTAVPGLAALKMPMSGSLMMRPKRNAGLYNLAEVSRKKRKWPK
jgi:hypothetical protein